MSEAQHKSQGIVGISLMVQIGDTPNPELRIITSTFNKVQYRGSSTPIRHISLRSLLPNTDAYLTYEGSTTHPGCWESTVWIILNKPIYITKQEVGGQSVFIPLTTDCVGLIGNWLVFYSLYSVVRPKEAYAGQHSNPKGSAGE